MTVSEYIKSIKPLTSCICEFCAVSKTNLTKLYDARDIVCIGCFERFLNLKNHNTYPKKYKYKKPDSNSCLKIQIGFKELYLKEIKFLETE